MPNATEPSAFKITPLLLCMLFCNMAMMAFVTLIGPYVRLLGVSELIAGLAMASGGLFWMLMAQWWGRQSDRYGRKPILMIGSGVFALAYCSMAVFVDVSLHRSLPLWVITLALIIGRALIGGFFGAVPPTSTAMIADHTNAQTRHLSMAKLSSAMALGMVMGPAVISWVAGYGLEWGYYANGMLSLLAFVIIGFGLPKNAKPSTATAATSPHNHTKQSRATTPIQGKLSLFDRRLLMPSFVSFAAILTMSVTQICLGFFVMDRMHLAEGPATQVTGIVFMGVGIAMLCAQQVVMRLHRVSVFQWLVMGTSLCGFGYGSVMFVASQTPLLVCFAIGSLGIGFLFPAFQAMTANAVSAHEQGRAAGTVSTFQGMAMALGPVLGTLLYRLGPITPYLFITVLHIALTFVIVRQRQRLPL